MTKDDLPEYAIRRNKWGEESSFDVFRIDAVKTTDALGDALLLTYIATFGDVKLAEDYCDIYRAKKKWDRAKKKWDQEEVRQGGN